MGLRTILCGFAVGTFCFGSLCEAATRVAAGAALHQYSGLATWTTLPSPPLITPPYPHPLVAADKAAQPGLSDPARTPENEHHVTAAEELRGLTPRVKPGDQIVLANGRYADWLMTIDAKGTAEKPIVFRPATVGGVVFTGKSKLRLTGSENIIVRDVVFEACKVTNKSIVVLEGARNCRITGCRFVDSVGRKNDQVIRVTGSSSDNRVDHCWFVGNAARAVQIHVDAGTWRTEGYPTGTRIDHNQFQDVSSVKRGQGAANGRETIQVGYGGSAESESKAVVEYNVFLRCNGENECISNKTSSNIYRYNSFKDQGGCLSLRGGTNCLVEGNRFENMPGIHVQGSGHRVINNLLIGCGGKKKPGKQSVGGSIVLGYGMELRAGSEYPQHYKAATDCLVTNNTIVDSPVYGLFLGGGKNQDWRARGIRSVPPRGNRIINNLVVGQTGDLMVSDDAPDNTVDHNLLFAGGGATVSFVGRNPLKVEPMFVNRAAGDFRLAAGSPALNAGLRIPDAQSSMNIGANVAPVIYGPGEAGGE